MNILIVVLCIVDTFFVAYAVGLNSRHVLVVDPSLPALHAAASVDPSLSALHSAASVETSKPASATQTRGAPGDSATVPTITKVAPGKFADIGSTDERLQSTVQKAAAAGIIDPTQDQKFRPNDPVTRADFTRWMVRVRQVPLASADAPSYSDLDQFNPYYRDIEGATKAYLVQGYTVKGTPQKEFKPEQYITREEFAAMYGTFSGKRGRAEKLGPKEVAQYLSYNTGTSSFGSNRYKDVGDIDDWASKWVAVAQQAGVLEECFDVNPYAGSDDKKYLRPLQRMTRAEAVSILVKLYGLHIRTADDIAKGLEAEGVYYERPGLYKDAEVMYQNSLALKEKMLGIDNPNLAQSLNNLGSLYETQGDFARAEPFYRRAMEISEKSGSESPEFSRAVNGLALVYRMKGNYADAEKLYRQLLAKDQQSAGPDSAAVASDKDKLAELCALQNKQPEARQLQQQALELVKKLPGAQRVTTLPIPNTSAQPPSAPPRRVKDKWALVIGISKFKDPSINLNYAAKDAADFRQYLITEAGFAPDHVKLLTNEQATRDNIEGYLGDKWLGRLANPDDLVTVYISSHGSTTKEDVGVNFLVAYDTDKDRLLSTGIPMQWITKMIKEQVHCDRILLVMDVCHSGAAASAVKGLTREHGFDIDKVTVGTGQAILCSSLADQLSWESKKYQNSVFTRQLVEALRSKGRQTRLQDAFDFLRDKVQDEVLRDRYEMQTPVLKKAWQGDDIVLAVTPASPRPSLAESPRSK